MEKESFSGKNEFEKKSSVAPKNWIGSEKDIEKITDPNVKKFVNYNGSIPAEDLTVTFLLDRFNKLEDLFIDKDANEQEVNFVRAKIVKQIKEKTDKEIFKGNSLDEKKLADSIVESQSRGRLSPIDLNLPQNEQEQRKYVEGFLDNIENSNRECSDFAISSTTQALESSLEKMHPSIRNEIEARISLHDASELIKRANGWIVRESDKVGAGDSIGAALERARERGHDLNRKKIKTLFSEYSSANKEGIPNLKIGKAWDLLQEINNSNIYRDWIVEINKRMIYKIAKNKGKEDLSKEIFETLRDEKNKKVRFRYENLSKEAQKELVKKGFSENDFKWLFDSKGVESRDDEFGEEPTNFYADSDSRRKEAVKNFAIEILGGDQFAKKSFQLAEKLSIATLETSVFNSKIGTGNDELGDIIGLKRWRKDRASSGRERGPAIHEDFINGFGTSYLRFVLGDIGIDPNNKDKKLNNNEKILSKYILENIDKIQEGSHAYFCSVVIFRYYSLSKLLLDRKPEPFKINKTTLQKAIPYFDLVDKGKFSEDEKKQLKNKFYLESKNANKKAKVKIEDNELKNEVEKKVNIYEKKYVKYGKEKLRLWWIAGVVDMALNDVDLEWDGKAFAELRKAVIYEELSPEKGSFLSKEQWDWITKATNYSSKLNQMINYRFRDTYKPKF